MLAEPIWGMSAKSARLLLRKLRRAMVDPEREPLASLVEADETSLPFRAAHHGEERHQPDVQGRLDRRPV